MAVLGTGFEEAWVLLPVISFTSSAIGSSAPSGVGTNLEAGLVDDGLYAAEYCSSVACDFALASRVPMGEGCYPPAV